jgi:hypothetical protein
MLSRLAATLRGRQTLGGGLGGGIEGIGGEGGEGATVVLDENCLVRVATSLRCAEGVG